MEILITGGNSLIAQAMALDRIRRGDSVILTASTESRLEKLQSWCCENGASCAVFNLLTPERCSTLDEHFATVDGLILNAATRTETLDRFHMLPADEVDAAIDANIKGNVFLLRKVLPWMEQKNFGRIIFISSVSAAMGTSRYGLYCLHKAALEGLILNLAVDYASCNVLANIVRLGIFRTSRTEQFWKREKYEKRASSVIPQGQLGDPGSIPDAIHPLMCANQYINGTIINISGGLPLMKVPAV